MYYGTEFYTEEECLLKAIQLPVASKVTTEVPLHGMLLMKLQGNSYSGTIEDYIEETMNFLCYPQTATHNRRASVIYVAAYFNYMIGLIPEGEDYEVPTEFKLKLKNYGNQFYNPPLFWQENGDYFRRYLMGILVDYVGLEVSQATYRIAMGYDQCLLDYQLRKQVSNLSALSRM